MRNFMEAFQCVGRKKLSMSSHIKATKFSYCFIRWRSSFSWPASRYFAPLAGIDVPCSLA